MKIENPNVLLLSSILQYIEKAYELLYNILKSNFEYILIDRMAFGLMYEKITLQVVPPHIYEDSYPCRFFDKNEFIKYFKNKNYSIIESFDTLDGRNDKYEFKGMIMEKKIKDV